MNIDKAIKSLRLNGYEVSFFKNAEDAAIYLNNNIDNKLVGFGDSITLLSMNLFEILSSHNKIFDPQHCTVNTNFIDIAKKSLISDIYITSINALAETGELVNIDGTGNRIAGSIFGHKKVYFIVGTNKLVPTLQEAIWRARNIAAPQNAMRLGLKTPCAKKGGHCFDCSSPDRICNGMMIYMKKMDDIDMEIVLINEALGF
ncbi:lactate utilization protein [Anaerovorax sp. IOR16]|uniref:lactate utilization protein n=1 Tax=Anaerovorax sp. IOR16 TaxID=2773458 RepID=UPI0019D092B2|nr:lactate utilization protein [Anaerovorax sp. IOR16]